MKNFVSYKIIFVFLSIMSACSPDLAIDETKLIEKENLDEIRNWYENEYLLDVTINNRNLDNILSTKTPKWDLAKSLVINNSEVLIVPLQKEPSSEKVDYIIVKNYIESNYNLTFINLVSETGEIHEDDVFGFGKFTGLSNEMDMEGNYIRGAYYKNGIIEYYISKLDSMNNDIEVKNDGKSFKTNSIWNISWIVVHYAIDYGNGQGGGFNQTYILSSSYEMPPQLPLSGIDIQVPDAEFACSSNQSPADCASTIASYAFGFDPGLPVPIPSPNNTYCHQNPLLCDWEPTPIDYGDTYEQTTIIEIGFEE